MTGKMIQKWLDSRTDLTNFQMETDDHNIVIEFEFYEVDEAGNYLEPGDTVILLDKGADIFVGFNKASWSCLNNYGYGYVIKKHPVNTNGGEPLKTPEDFNVSA